MSFSIYIPRMLGTVNKKMVYDTFNRMGIGHVTELDMIYKINEKKNAYYFAFIKISPYNTPQFNELKQELNEKKRKNLVYDEEAGQYWVINKYIPRDKRNTNPPPLQYNDSVFAPFSPSIWTPFEHIIKLTKKKLSLYTVFDDKDKLDLVKEYEEIEREIDRVRNNTSYV
jgi:hypothetical protein